MRALRHSIQSILRDPKAQCLNMSDSIFEIREYLDGEGKVNGHDVTDISKELEYMEKLVNSMQENPTALNDDDQFIRDLALLSQDQSSIENESFDDDFFQNIEANEAQGAKKTSAPAAKKVSGVKSTSGWGKGFLSQSKPTKTTAKTTDSLVTSTQQLNINESNKDNTLNSVSTLATAPETVFTSTPVTTTTPPLKGILKHTTPTITPTTTSNNTTTINNNTTTNNTTPTTTTESVNSAFSGSIMERAPAKTVTKLGTGSKGVVLGGPRKNV